MIFVDNIQKSGSFVFYLVIYYSVPSYVDTSFLVNQAPHNQVSHTLMV